MKTRIVLTSSMLAIVAGSLLGQSPTPLFTEVLPPSSSEPPLGAVSSTPVVVNIDGLKFAPQAITIVLPTGVDVTATLNSFEVRAGFDEFGVPLPEATPEELSYLWNGVIGTGSAVVLTVEKGIMSGIIVDPMLGQFSVVQTLSGDRMLEIDESLLPPEDSVDPPSPITFPIDDPARSEPPVVTVAAGQEVVIDILFAYTEAAREDAGGLAGDASDDRKIRAAIRGAVDRGNVVLANSQLDHRIQLRIAGIINFDEVTPEGVEKFVPSGNERNDIITLTDNPILQEQRERFQADIVSVIVRDSSHGGMVPVCGTAVTQRKSCGDNDQEIQDLDGCDVGLAFKPFAYHYVALNCLQTGFTLTHETGHNLGLEHQPHHRRRVG